MVVVEIARVLQLASAAFSKSVNVPTWLVLQIDYQSIPTEVVENCLDCLGGDWTWLKKIARSHGIPLGDHVGEQVVGLEVVDPSEAEGAAGGSVSHIRLDGKGLHLYRGPFCFEIAHQPQTRLYASVEVVHL